jgi:phosphoglycolate phosphatase
MMNARSRIKWHGRTLEGVVFDLDGTLTDSIDVYYEVVRKAAVQLGVRIGREEIFRPLAEGSEPWDGVFPQDLPDRRETIRAFRRAMRPAFFEALKRVRPLAGVPEVLDTLNENGIRMGLVTDSFSGSLEPLRTAGLIRYFAATVTQDDGFPRKPDPQGLLECLSRMGADAAHGVVVGDTLMDVAAGQRAGTLTIGVLSGLASREQLETARPTALVDELGGILELFGLKVPACKAIRG